MKKIVITEEQLNKIVEQTHHDETYFDTFSEAVQTARKRIEDRGFEIDQDDWWSEVNVGQGRPKDGQTTRMTIGLIKNDKPQKKALHIQVYNRGHQFRNNYELNYYVS